LPAGKAEEGFERKSGGLPRDFPSENRIPPGAPISRFLPAGKAEEGFERKSGGLPRDFPSENRIPPGAPISRFLPAGKAEEMEILEIWRAYSFKVVLSLSRLG